MDLDTLAKLGEFVGGIFIVMSTDPELHHLFVVSAEERVRLSRAVGGP
jgi:hypothetical protein